MEVFMLNRKPVFVVFVILITMAVVASQVMASLEEWETAADPVSMNPDMAYAHSGNYLQTAGQYDRNGDGRVDLIIADRNGLKKGKLRDYIKKFIRYSSFSHLTVERREILAGTFAYLKDDHDMIPDDVPNIGYLDDLMVFVEAAKHFISTGAPISGVCNAEEVLEDLQFVQRNMGLMFGDQHFSISSIKKLGQKHVGELKQLAEEIRNKYKHLGDLEND
jgi:uncharacterized membrane protein YkvA (DUF1232 family)